ncbi:MAG: tetratricopeptide repeat protein [Dysgonamonadaceae bacterium]|jgi:tetratricopeptide (TPR) repeat protein|nr:tetratricopeptide repeat protein [Dysgonamonadaceae bacterium]
MKQTVFITVFVLFAASIAFGQKKAVKVAANEIKGASSNIAEARAIIKDALTNPETAETAEAWFVAGSIENKQFDMERTKELLGKQPDEAVMYAALDAILPCFEKALEYDARPDAKGKVKPKYTKSIRAIMLANRPFYSNAGIYYYNNKNYEKAYGNFKLYGDYRKMDLFKDEKWTTPDSVENQIRYYAGLSAAFIPNHQAAIEIFEEIKDGGVNEVDIYRALAGEYMQLEDSAGFEKTINEGFKKFPTEDYFLLNLINQSISKGKSGEAIAYLDAAIAKDPENAQLYDVLGQIYEGEKNNDEAIKYMKKAIELKPDSVDFLSHLGRVYFNMGFEKRNEADQIKEPARYKIENQKAMDYFKEAMPYFERAVAIDSANKGVVLALSQIYYTLGMGKEYEKMDALYNSLQDE